MEPETSLEKEIQGLAQTLYRDAAKHKPSLFESHDWMGQMIEWSLKDESLRAALFRFVDVLPSLDSASEISRHLQEYFAKVDHALGGLVFLAQSLHAGWLVAPVVKHSIVKLARRFIVEEDTDSLASVLTELRTESAAFTLDVVGEETVSHKESIAMQRRYLDLLQRLAPVVEKWQPLPQIDIGSKGLIPKINLSVKLSSLYPRFDPLDPDTEVILTYSSPLKQRGFLRANARLCESAKTAKTVSVPD